MMEKIPTYFLIDTSLSMLGDPMRAVNRALKYIAVSMRSDQYLLQSACISIITFDDQARVDVSLTNLSSAVIPHVMPRGRKCMIGEAFSLVVHRVGCEVPGRSAQFRPPALIVISNGMVSDRNDFLYGIEVLETVNWRGVVTVGATEDWNETTLKALGNHRVNLGSGSEPMRGFQWLWQGAADEKEIPEDREDIVRRMPVQ